MTAPYGGTIWVAPVGTKPSDEGWRLLGHVSPGSVAFGHGDPLPKSLSKTITFNHYDPDPELLKLYYGTSAGINSGATRKEEKHMAVRKFEGISGGRLLVEPDLVNELGGIHLDVKDSSRTNHWNWFEKADVPLIAHALFEKSGWPKAEKDGDGGEFVTTVEGQVSRRLVVASEFQANYMLATAISALAAYNEWVEGKAEREAAEARKAEEEAKAAAEEARKKREHDELRTSPIAMEALALYNRALEVAYIDPYATWDAVNLGDGASDAEVKYWIAKAEAARAARPLPKVGDRVRVAAGAKACGGWTVFSGRSTEGTVIREADGDGDVRVRGDLHGTIQHVDPKYLTIEATERDAEVEKIQKAVGSLMTTAEGLYDAGLRVTA